MTQNEIFLHATGRRKHNAARRREMENRIARLIELQLSGLSRDEILAELGISRFTLHRYHKILKEAGRCPHCGQSRIGH